MIDRLKQYGEVTYYILGIICSVRFFHDIYHLMPIFKRFF